MPRKQFKLALYWKILIGMAIGVIWSFFAISFDLQSFTINWIKPFGTIFINALKLIAVPLVLASLIKGVSSLNDVTKLSRIGAKTIAIYVATTVIAISTGLVAVNLIRPGHFFSPEVRTELKSRFGSQVVESAEKAKARQEDGPLQFLVDLVPENIFYSLDDNASMLQVIFFALLFGIALVMIPSNQSRPVAEFFGSLNEIVLKIVDIIMLYAPVGVFALLASILVEIAGDDPGSAVQLLGVLAMYSLTVIGGLLFMIFIIYPLVLNVLGKRFSPLRFYRAIFPVQLLAFSTSSSAATLPLTMERCEEELGISKEITSFVLPLGATINMDGTSLYQGVAAVFIAQAYGIDLSFIQQLSIILTALLASIGTAAVPGAGVLMLVIVLNSVGIPLEGLALILAPDRLLDMLRTSTNVTGDATVATIVATSENQIMEPKAQN